MVRSRELSAAAKRMELLLAVLMSVAAVGTAWAGYQSSEWGGVQSDAYAHAGASRAEANRAATDAGQDRIIDVVAFGSWMDAVDDAMVADPSLDPADLVDPGGQTVEGFVFIRLRDEFRPAMAAWLEQDPFRNQDAPTTPFAMPEYQLADQQQAHELEQRARDFSAEAHDANRHSGKYVLTAVIFAVILFFSGIASSAEDLRIQGLLALFAVVVLVVAVGILITLPVTM